MNAHDRQYAGQIADSLREIAAFIEREGLDGLSPMQAYYVGTLIGETLRLREEERTRQKAQPDGR